MRFSHTALSVKSIERSQKFYESVFNLKFKSRGERKELRVRFVNLVDNKGSMLELFEHDESLALEEDLMEFQKAGIKHIAFEVESIEEVLDNAVKHGASIEWQPKPGITVKRVAFLRDPDGIPIELIEPKG
ncbi:MAG: hypothetical protein A3H57_04110 [Candidatus Taylorbacteria bacterium RIFCSPLOWO2_02_FULL_43_11]|uniref:VOC domain-containing protein n=1 Tax=Candidatus Taylorbacteria bacterium RIFCSPHIGHO2_02_FULL_43_32b TaxID=1802306 RepID=A0A1G2MP63_9BACT|nr:MAG: hypothetical protein A2743_03620 [Candidatus Taylorbacteria bacterium RIFCSPHIGHO2_01_FULL_43_47]OHA24782.1 MAG: hypothetical protein A3C72_01600 [Candidatus Taylorbacteria bacterium RIFCSPHIGHO2_02_FULL_43_32b]OHA31784.1 MAG: hypothetical protein A3B08_02565 [Candidatus Taylorbacteria bacterium RIFCSPLOWO2_01_FULL_43_44]OHA35525.1 MAG: hypothetical protein A3H57_04110 [Candidatus Taylorbacteria bacterium RIFCSPLOWO2_02_FULL_43_11]